MIRMTLAAAGATLMFAAAPVFAQTTPMKTSTPSAMTCRQQIAETDRLVSSMTSSVGKKTALDEEGMAKDSLAKNDEKGCLMHVQKAAALTKQS